MPTPTKSGSDDTNLPRRLASQSSPWYIGTVLVSMPVPIPVTYRAIIICATEYDVHCRMAPMIYRRVSNAAQRSGGLGLAAHNPSHSKPHANSPPESLADEERQDAPGEGAQVVYCHYDALERTAWLPESVAPVFVAYDAREDALIVTEQNCIHCSAGARAREWRLVLLNAIWQDIITAACKRHPLPNQFCFIA